MTKPKPPTPPRSLGPAGKALWKAILADIGDGWQLDARELDALRRACRCADELALLDKAVDKDGATTVGSRGQVVVHPALSEARQLRLAQARLLGSIELADPEQAGQTSTPAQAQARKAAATRWGRSHG